MIDTAGHSKEAVRLDGVDYLSITQETIDKVKGIYEESLLLFSGDKNADDVVAIISGRYNLYIDEMR